MTLDHQKLFRPQPKLVSDGQRAMANLINEIVQYHVGNLIPQENMQSYEHGINISYHDAEGKPRQSSLKPHEATSEISIPDVIEGNFSGAVNTILQVTDRMAKSLKDTIFAKLTEITSETGNVVDGKGKPLSGEMLLEALELTGVTIDKDNKVSIPTMVMSPAMTEKAKTIMDDPTFKIKFDAILERKTTEAIEQESKRKSRFPKKPAVIK